jgi:hypothetical protein
MGFLSRKKKGRESSSGQGEAGYAGSYHYEVDGDDNESDGGYAGASQEEIDAILRLIRERDFDWCDENIGTVPHTPYRREDPDDPDTEKMPTRKK